MIGRRATVESVYNFLDGHGRQGRNGTVALRRALADWLLGDRPPDSALELGGVEGPAALGAAPRRS